MVFAILKCTWWVTTVPYSYFLPSSHSGGPIGVSWGSAWRQSPPGRALPSAALFGYLFLFAAHVASCIMPMCLREGSAS